jgi:hypothetical protein
VEPRNDWRCADGEVRITRVKWLGDLLDRCAGHLQQRQAGLDPLRYEPPDAVDQVHWSRPAALLALVSTSVRPGDVVVGDRNFLSHADLTVIPATGAHAVFRVKAGVDPPVLRVCDDGSWISRIADPAASRRLRRKGLRGKDIPGIQVSWIGAVSASPSVAVVAGQSLH